MPRNHRKHGNISCIIDLVTLDILELRLPWKQVKKSIPKAELSKYKWLASKAEAHRYRDLRLLERAGEIKDLKTQVRFPIVVNGTQVCAYVADFVYFEDGQEVIEWTDILEDEEHHD